jgi:nitrile hydratase subunit beta
MNGVHDLGGMHGFGAVIREPNEPVFHSDWEKRVFALTLTAMGRRVCNVDEFRRAIERMPPAGYLAATYYEKWLHALESLLVEKGVATREEIANGHAAAPAPAATSLDDEGGGVESFDSAAVQLRFDPKFKPGFKVGDRVVARNLNPEHHTRLPRYARGKRGVIRYDQGVFVFPDTHAHGQGGKPQHVYTVAFEAQELWGADHTDRALVYLDCWEDYLERDRTAAAKPAAKSPVKTTSKPTAKPTAKRTVKTATAKAGAKTRTLKVAAKVRASKPAAKVRAAKPAANVRAAKPAVKSSSRLRAPVKKGPKRQHRR